MLIDKYYLIVKKQPAERTFAMNLALPHTIDTLTLHDSFDMLFQRTNRFRTSLTVNRILP